MKRIDFYQILISLNELINAPVEGVKFSTFCKIQRNFKALFPIEEERKRILETPDQTKESINEALLEYMGGEEDFKLETFTEAEFENVTQAKLFHHIQNILSIGNNGAQN